MQYYIMLPGDTEADCINETNLLGDSSFGTFYSGTGMKVLMRIVDKRPKLLTEVTIKTDTNKTLSVEEFLKDIEGLKIISPRY